MITLLDMSMGLLILGFIMLVTNILTVYFTFTSWYGQKKEKQMISYTVDDDGKYHFDFDER